jgi:hypothetical protein
MPSEEVAVEHQFFIRQQNIRLYRDLVAASEAAAAKADARQEKLLKLLAEEVANEPPPRKNKELRPIAEYTAHCWRRESRTLQYQSRAPGR